MIVKFKINVSHRGTQSGSSLTDGGTVSDYLVNIFLAPPSKSEKSKFAC